MFLVGNVSEKAQDLCRVTKHCLDEAIKICGPGVPIREVGKVSSRTQELPHHNQCPIFAGGLRKWLHKQ